MLVVISVARPACTKDRRMLSNAAGGRLLVLEARISLPTSSRSSTSECRNRRWNRCSCSKQYQLGSVFGYFV